MTLLKLLAIWGSAGTVASLLIGRAIRTGMTSEPLREVHVLEDAPAPSEHAAVAF